MAKAPTLPYSHVRYSSLPVREASPSPQRKVALAAWWRKISPRLPGHPMCLTAPSSPIPTPPNPRCSACQPLGLPQTVPFRPKSLLRWLKARCAPPVPDWWSQSPALPGRRAAARPSRSGLVHLAAIAANGQVDRLERRYDPTLGRAGIRKAATRDALELLKGLMAREDVTQFA